MKNLEQNNNNNTNKGSSNTALYVILIVIGVILLIGLAYFLGKKFNESRKRRANELRDDDFDYSADKKGNSNSNDIINDS
jgi:flagellar basal body-associated protein FliL